MEKYSGISQESLEKSRLKKADFESIGEDLGPPDEEHEGVAFWQDGDDFHAEFPNATGETEAVYVTPSYLEWIGNDNKIKKTYDLETSSLAREVQRFMRDVQIEPKVKDKLKLIFIRIAHER